MQLDFLLDAEMSATLALGEHVDAALVFHEALVDREYLVEVVQLDGDHLHVVFEQLDANAARHVAFDLELAAVVVLLDHELGCCLRHTGHLRTQFRHDCIVFCFCFIRVKIRRDRALDKP